MRSAAVTAAVVLAASAICAGVRADPGEAASPRVAVFVQNRGGADLDSRIDSFRDMLLARLAGEGLTVISRQDAIDRFKSSGADQALERVEALAQGELTLDDASALRLAQMLDADYLAVASLDSLGNRTTSAAAFGVANQVEEYTLRLSLRMLDAGRGTAVIGDSVAVTEKIPATDSLRIEDNGEYLNSLLSDGAERLAANIGAQARTLAPQAPPGAVPFTLALNGVDGATVELDGMVIGSAGQVPTRYAAAPGIHFIRITRDWFEPWARRINVYDGQTLTITMELSDAGLARYKDLEGFKQAMAESQAGIDIAREQSEADAYAKKQLAEGEKKRLEESYERIDTSNVTDYSVGDNTPRVIVEEKKEQ
ncbi:MAG TPA: PEGA domain-containing protein [bacterium]|nr:PEGA domain-containing protein [bacterium]HPQ65308.1 PEGA domain-containing protein [bacterium]